jgi:hypothetical protein
VHDPALVGGAHGAQQLLDEVEAGVDVEAHVLLEVRPQRPALHVLHDYEKRALVLVEVVDADDARVVEGRDRLGLALEAQAEARVLAEGLGQHLDRHWHPEARMGALVDDAHGAAAQLGLHAEAAEPGDWHDSRSTRQRFDLV